MLEGGTKFDRRKHPKNASNMAHQHAKCFTLEKSRMEKNLNRWSTESGCFWRTGLESCAFKPFRETATSTASKVFSEEGSRSNENHFRLPIMLVADR